MSGLLASGRPLAHQRLSRQATRADAELLLQPRFDLAGGGLVAFEATAFRQRRSFRHQPSMRDAMHEPREPSRDVARDGAMFQRACMLAANSRSATPWVLSLRITEAQVACGLLTSLIADSLAACGLSPQRMELEFSEGSLETDEAELLYLLAALRDLGVGLALGGFGGSISSLTLLRRRSLAGLLSALKLHPLLLGELSGDGDNGFLRGLIATAHALGLRVVADGIENAVQHQRLQEARCDQGLGTWLGEPLPASEALQAIHPGAVVVGFPS